MSRRLPIPPKLRELQTRASDPRTSAWASANAGSGKTHVLTQRVLRLLLDRTPPAQILCVAYTKAAAANMAERVFGKLARWTSLDDDALAKAIVDCGAPEPERDDLVFARQLFARTIETPGGLKIQTLHGFAERLLKLFPFEANVPAHFKVIDERESALLLIEARDSALAELEAAPQSAAALDLVAREAGAHRFDDLIKEALSRAEAFGAYDDAGDYAAALGQALGLAPGATAANVEAEMLGGEVERGRREAWARQLDLGAPRDLKLAKRLRAASDDMTYAELKNAAGSFVSPTPETVSAAMATAKIPDDFRFSIVNAPGEQAYPISGASWIIIYQDQKDPDVGKKLVAFLKWGITDGQKISATLDYAPLPDAIVQRELKVLETVK